MKKCLFLILPLICCGCSVPSFWFFDLNREALITDGEKSVAYASPDAAVKSDQSGLPLIDPDYPAEKTDSIPSEVLWIPENPGGEKTSEISRETAEDIALLETAPVFEQGEGNTVARDEIVFDFPVVENDRVRYFIDLYSGNARGTFKRWLERSGRYLPMMREIFSQYDLPLDLTYLAMIESGFTDRAYSWAHAAGPWQFIESTGRVYDLHVDWWLDERRDPEKATHAAARFLRDMYEFFDGDWYLAVASYNAGMGKIQRAIEMYDSRDFWEISRGKYLQEETKHYLPKLLAALTIAKQPEKYGFTDLDYHEPLTYDVVEVSTATDLELVAELCGVSYEEIKKLNPELKRWSTPPAADKHSLRLPPGSSEPFLEKFLQIPVAERARYKRHEVVSGDTLLRIAKRHGIQVDDIVRLNKVSNPRALKIGSTLILPLRQGYTSRPLDELEDDYVRSYRRSYTVREGDSLWKISRRFEVSEKQLRVWNKLGWSNLLRPGQKLVVSAAGAKSTRSNRQPTKQLVYEVKSGDTLWDIGQRYNVGTREIMNWNNLDHDHVLHPGDSLTLMVAPGHSG